MERIQLTEALPDDQCDALAGTFLDLQHYDRVVRDDAIVLKPDGTPLLFYVKDAIPRNLCEVAFSVFKLIDVGSSHNRGLAAGIINDQTDFDGRDIGEIDGTRFRPMKDDGTISRTTYAPSVNSAIVGYFDRYPRIPYCRMTAFNLDHHSEFEAARPFVAAVSRKFRDLVPDRWAAQRAFVDAVSNDFIILGTVFSTITVNRSWRTATHKDKGDLKEGFGVMSVLEGGSYSGCELIFPKYRTAVDMRTGGLCLADVHEYHGNAPLVGLPGQYVRISLVFYVREKMRECGSAAEERERAKRLGKGNLFEVDDDVTVEQ